MVHKIVDNGDSAISIIFNEAVSEKLAIRIIKLAEFLKHEYSDELIEVIPAYQSLTLCYDPLIFSEDNLKKSIEEKLALEQEPETELTGETFKTIEIPICYEEEYAPDLAELSQYCGLSKEQVIEYHSQADYRVYMLGFLPGFLYLGGLSSKLFCPRKETPALEIEAGSVGIGGNQTGIYPVNSPGGWHIIGRTPVHLFNPQKQQPFIASPLDKIRFIPISVKEFERLSKVSL